jgi:hypothetical protein
MKQSFTSSTKQLSLIMFIGGALGLIFGCIHLISYLSSDSSISLSDAGFNAGSGAIEICAGWFFSKGKKIGILFVVTAILASLVYSYQVGRGFNFITLILGSLFLIWIISFWRRGDLS